MKYILKDYQERASAELVRALRAATRDSSEDKSDLQAISLSAPTGAGKTVIATAVIETLFHGSTQYPQDPQATVLWVTDAPALNEQTRRKMIVASTSLQTEYFTTIDSSFDQAVFDTNHIYFLNIQKLARTNVLAQSGVDLRTYSLWQTISNSINAYGSHFYLVIDEAHRGMNPYSDRNTIVSRIVDGQPGINPPAPVVWGISATPQRFLESVSNRTVRPVSVTVDQVRSSGLLKDLIVLDNPAESSVESDTTLVRAGAVATKDFERSWRTYTETQGEPPVLPIMVVQVPNSPSNQEMEELISSVLDAWPEISSDNIVNTFADHIVQSYGRHSIRYVAPQEIQDDLRIRVVLCKDAISTGWDCPRAEVLVSLRVAEDFTYISQLIGRMVRTPLARRVPTDQWLNTVSCYLPKFNRVQVQSIVGRFKSGNADDPPVDAITNPVRIWQNTEIDSEVIETLRQLPTYIVPGKNYRSQVSRLYSLATLLAGDSIAEDAITFSTSHLISVLNGYLDQFASDGTLDHHLHRIKNVQLERSFALLNAESIDDLPPSSGYQVELDENNIEDLFLVAQRKLPEGLARAIWEVLFADQDNEYSSIDAKAIVASLALRPEVVESVETTAAQLVHSWLRLHHRSISLLNDSRRLAYDPIRREAADPEETELSLPESWVESEQEQNWPKHVYASEAGTFPFKPREWEELVLNRELADDTLVGWYRNPASGDRSINVPYSVDSQFKAMHPDFVFFHRRDQDLVASIVDPHGFHLSDALPKLTGLAQYAKAHGAAYARIESVIKTAEGQLMSLDLKSHAVRSEIERFTGTNVIDLFMNHGGNY